MRTGTLLAPSSSINQSSTSVSPSATRAISALTAGSHLLLATALEQLGEEVEAVPHYIRALELYRISVGPQHPQTLFVAIAVAARTLDRGGMSLTTELLEESWALTDGLSGPEDAPFKSTIELNNLGFAFWLRGDYAVARKMYLLALGQGPDPTALNNLGMIEERLGGYTAAVNYYRQAMSVLREQDASSVRSMLQARVSNNLGVSLTLGGDPASGGSCLNEALAMRGDSSMGKKLLTMLSRCETLVSSRSVMVVWTMPSASSSRSRSARP